MTTSRTPVIEYSYGIATRADVAAGRIAPHRRDMRKWEAEDWLEQWRNECAETDAQREMFVMIRRPLGDWEVVPSVA